ncbi:hypothetical protein [Laspinema olomoucense]|uniref:Uncharacterized protein n=1 Tax=Laspinema olomoucense D3b TaxID=2953688 RepID=A0ABT2N707_9CYAN|nr:MULTISPECIES: hypothetical protein [unclassified Laspinema]MCT7974069.1 hypothetical protein [Laspinema sp. D3d]MCT7978478.1 hypothetical protein [Laspinema sp. D3b]MCT7991826.1 hypothetical protein [Laspinema sp. D3a]MCT7997299.1 hypothetical protein [Laspinema sp. D3c]
MVIPPTINCTSGPLPLARGGLGWGSLFAIAKSRTQKRRSHLPANILHPPIPSEVRSHLTKTPP